ncbi:hypothetical protein BJ742DRAFT_766945 [Cladochytrium replicatum]|nr:hypothetical protein BJ742DRAFT_766945 [Cladochytrium replicatum]
MTTATSHQVELFSNPHSHAPNGSVSNSVTTYASQSIFPSPSRQRSRNVFATPVLSISTDRHDDDSSGEQEGDSAYSPPPPAENGRRTSLLPTADSAANLLDTLIRRSPRNAGDGLHVPVETPTPPESLTPSPVDIGNDSSELWDGGTSPADAYGDIGEVIVGDIGRFNRTWNREPQPQISAGSIGEAIYVDVDMVSEVEQLDPRDYGAYRARDGYPADPLGDFDGYQRSLNSATSIPRSGSVQSSYAPTYEYNPAAATSVYDLYRRPSIFTEPSERSHQNDFRRGSGSTTTLRDRFGLERASPVPRSEHVRSSRNGSVGHSSLLRQRPHRYNSESHQRRESRRESTGYVRQEQIHKPDDASQNSAIDLYSSVYDVYLTSAVTPQSNSHQFNDDLQSGYQDVPESLLSETEFPNEHAYQRSPSPPQSVNSISPINSPLLLNPDSSPMRAGSRVLSSWRSSPANRTDLNFEADGISTTVIPRQPSITMTERTPPLNPHKNLTRPLSVTSLSNGVRGKKPLAPLVSHSNAPANGTNSSKSLSLFSTRLQFAKSPTPKDSYASQQYLQQRPLPMPSRPVSQQHVEHSEVSERRKERPYLGRKLSEPVHGSIPLTAPNSPGRMSPRHYGVFPSQHGHRTSRPSSSTSVGRLSDFFGNNGLPVSPESFVNSPKRVKTPTSTGSSGSYSKLPTEHSVKPLPPALREHSRYIEALFASKNLEPRNDEASLRNEGPMHQTTSKAPEPQAKSRPTLQLPTPTFSGVSAERTKAWVSNNGSQLTVSPLSGLRSNTSSLPQSLLSTPVRNEREVIAASDVMKSQPDERQNSLLSLSQKLNSVLSELDTTVGSVTLPSVALRDAQELIRVAKRSLVVGSEDERLWIQIEELIDVALNGVLELEQQALEGGLASKPPHKLDAAVEPECMPEEGRTSPSLSLKNATALGLLLSLLPPSILV